MKMRTGGEAMHEASEGTGTGGHFGRRLAVLGAVALVAFAISGALARDAQAQGEPFSFELNHGLINIGILNGIRFLNEATGPATFENGTIDPATGDFTIPADGIFLPPNSQTFPFPGAPGGVVILELSFTPLTDLTGNFDSATGEVDTDVTISSRVDVFIPADPDPFQVGACEMSPIPLGFSTSGTNPYPGVPFTEGVDGPGAVVASWSAMPVPVPVPPLEDDPFNVCNIVAGFVEGPGGVWLSHDIESPPIPPRPPALTLSVRPARAAVKPGRSTTFEAGSRNTGELVAPGVEVCARVPNGLRINGVSKGQVCKEVGDLQPGPAATEAFRVRTTRSSAGKTFTLRFSASGTGVRAATDFATLKVKRKKRR
jgi:hypothetical protein